MANVPFNCRRFAALRVRIINSDDKLPAHIKSATWRKQRILATPAWADMESIKALYDRAKHLTEKTGELYTVDHIVPLRHPRVCGLHVASNLQVIAHDRNVAKSNNYDFGDQETL